MDAFHQKLSHREVPVVWLIFFAMVLLPVRALCLEKPLYEQSRDIVSRYSSIFTEPPVKIPGNVAVDAPLLGNGDMGVAIGGDSDYQRFFIAKNDFWRLKSQYGESSPKMWGSLDIEIPLLKDADYHIEQSLYDAVTSSTFTQGGSSLTMRSWVAATANILVIELSAEKGAFGGIIHLKPGRSEDSETRYGRMRGGLWAARRFDKGTDISVEAACALKISGTRGTAFKLWPGDSIILTCAMTSSFVSSDCLRDARERVETADIAALRDEHALWWREYWAKSFVNIGDPAIEQLYYQSLYTMGSCSRNPEFPPPIFGSWITTDTPAWFGDYHLNYNHMAPYYALYSANRLEQADPYHAPLLAFMERGRWYAKNTQNIRGIMFPVGIGPKGIETTRNAARHKDWHKEEGGLFFGQKSNSAYSLVNIAMRWYRTYDSEYGRKLYPLVRGVADFWEDYLTFENGRYIIYNDTIHEGSGDGKDFNPILSLGLVRNVFALTIDMSTTLGVDGIRHTKWQHILKNISKFPTQERDGKTVFRYTEQGTDWWPDNTLGIQHIYPAGAIGLDSDPKLLETAHNTIEVMDRWIDFNGMNSFLPAAVRVGYDPEVILGKLRYYATRRIYPNGFALNNPHGIENTSIVPNTINEMLCMGHGGVLRVFPVWPLDRDASFTNIRCEGAFLVSSEIVRDEVSHVSIVSERGRECTMVNPWPGYDVLLAKNGLSLSVLSGDRLSFPTSAGDILLLKRK